MVTPRCIKSWSSASRTATTTQNAGRKYTVTWTMVSRRYLARDPWIAAKYRGYQYQEEMRPKTIRKNWMKSSMSLCNL